MSHARADLFYFMRIKAIHPNGYIKRSDGFLAFISKSLKESKATSHNRLKSCIERGFIIPTYSNNEVVGYRLISNNDFWSKLGYKKNEVTKERPRGNGFTKGAKILKIEFNNTINKKALVEKVQEFDIYQKGLRILHKKKNSGTPRTTGVTFDLSCAGFSNILGYKSAMKGHNVKKRMTSKKLIKVTHRDPKLIERVHIKTHIEKVKSMKSAYAKHDLTYDNKEFFSIDKKADKPRFGFVYERQCDMITLLYDYPLAKHSSVFSKSKKEVQVAKDEYGISKCLFTNVSQSIRNESKNSLQS
jgi:hypothetical protein